MPSKRQHGPLRSPQRKRPTAVPATASAALDDHDHDDHEVRPDRGSRGSRGPRAEASAESQKLQKVLAQTGLGSRRAMETWIEAGRVSVNGKIVGIGTRIMPSDRILVDGREVRVGNSAPATRVLIYHKPEGEIVTRDDPQGRETVFTRLPPLRGSRWLSIGRLDVSTSGLLLFTTSGELANTMMHPRFEVEREYAVRIFGKLTPEQSQQLLDGVTLEDGPAHCNSLEDEGGEGSNHWYRVIMTEGRNRVVRRMFEAIGFTVSRLLRVRFGIMHLPPRLKRGQVEELTPDQVRQLGAWLEKAARPAAKLDSKADSKPALTLNSKPHSKPNSKPAARPPAPGQARRAPREFRAARAANPRASK